MHVKHLDHLNMSVGDLAAARAWYARVFGFDAVEQGVHEGRPWAILKSGDALLCLYEYRERKAPDPDVHGHHGLSHFGLRITDRAAWEATVKRERVEVLYGGAVHWPHSTAWYVQDPTGNEIEVALWSQDRVSFAR